MESTPRFAKYSKKTLGKRAGLVREIELNRGAQRFHKEKQDEAARDAKSYTISAGQGNSYAMLNLERACGEERSRALAIERLQSREAELRAAIEGLDNPSLEESENRIKNQAALVETERQRRALEAVIEGMAAKLSKTLQQHQELTSTMLNLAGKVELDLSGGGSWFDGNVARSLLASLSNVDLRGDSERHAEWFGRELAGEDHPVERAAPLTGLNSPGESARRYERLPATIAQRRYEHLRRQVRGA
jgi:hypothetical protein